MKINFGTGIKYLGILALAAGGIALVHNNAKQQALLAAEDEEIETEAEETEESEDEEDNK